MSSIRCQYSLSLRSETTSQQLRVQVWRATAKAANVYTFAACRLLTTWYEVGTFIME
jgi:hypothetical protein